MLYKYVPRISTGYQTCHAAKRNTTAAQSRSPTTVPTTRSSPGEQTTPLCAAHTASTKTIILVSIGESVS